MSLYPPQSCSEGVWQYCNYGYDRTVYNSYNQCVKQKTKQDCGILAPSHYVTNRAFLDGNTILISAVVVVSIILLFAIIRRFVKKSRWAQK